MRIGAGWTIAALAGLAAAVGVVGSDVLWLVPLGSVVAHGHVPDAVPFATAPTHGWHDVPAAAQLLFWGLYHALGGVRGLVAAQVCAAAAGFGTLAAGIRRDAGTGAAIVVSLVVLAGSLPAVVIVNVSLWSLAFFPLLLALVQAESRAPGRRIWLVVPLVLLWGNLHGGVLNGVALLACYLMLERARREPLVAGGVLAASVAALFVNPELWRTPLYYRAVFGSVLAREGSGLWTPLGTGGFDLVLVGCALALVALAARGRPRLWEAVAVIGLAVATVRMARNGMPFLMLTAYPAARALRLAPPRPRLLCAAAVVFTAAAAALLV
ncbi:MAG: hypothetical protein ACRDL2_17755, partial [Gaiellaceae bacterium]